MKKDERWSIRENKEIKDTLKGSYNLKFLRLRWYGHVGRIQNQRIPTPTATVTMEGTRKRGRSRKRWRDENEVD